MHTISWASGQAIARLMKQDELAEEAASYAELARNRLQLDNSMAVAALMFAQPLVTMWEPHWKFAYTIGISLGAKLATEGFYLIDIIERLTSDFPMKALREGERKALEHFNWVNMTDRLLLFRNALVHVAIEEPLPLLEQAHRPIYDFSHGEFHALVVDASADALAHAALIVRTQPDARVHTCSTVDAALAYKRRCDNHGLQINLVLLDLDLNEHADDENLPLTELLEGANGFDVANAMDGIDISDGDSSNGSDSGTVLSEASTRLSYEGMRQPRTDFVFRPFVAMATHRVNELMAHADAEGWSHTDSSILTCDAVVSKPLDAPLVRVLVESSEI